MATPTNVSNVAPARQYARVVTTNALSLGLGVTVTTANTAKDGTGTVVTPYNNTSLADSVCDGIYVAFTGTSVATVLRIFINNGLTNASAGNNSLLKSVSVPANTLSEVAAAPDFFVPLDITLPPGYKINCTIGTSVAAALALTGVGADYGV